MVYRSSGRGSFIVERTVAGVHIRRASGTTDPGAYDGILHMLDEINEAGREDLARMVASGQMKAVVLWNAWRRQGLSLQLSPERSLVLKTAVEAWLKKMGAKRARDPQEGLAEDTRQDYQYAMDDLRHGAANATAGDLPSLLLRYRDRAPARQFSKTRSIVQAFVRDNVTGGRYSQLWLDVSKVEARKKSRRKKGHPQPVVRARLIAEELGGKFGSVWWTMCCTGMGNKEYFETPWKVFDGHIHIFGTKREFRDRDVPRLCTPIRPPCHERTFEKELRKAVAALKEKGTDCGRVTIYDGRRTFAHWMEISRRIPKSRRDVYLGHAPADETALYEDHDATYYLAADRAALLEFIGQEPKFLRAMA